MTDEEEARRRRIAACTRHYPIPSRTRVWRMEEQWCRCGAKRTVMTHRWHPTRKGEWR